MKILVLNAGSSSIKYQLFDMPEGLVLASGKAEKIGEAEGILSQKAGAQKLSFNEPVPDHARALERILQMLTEGEGAPVTNIQDIKAVGHRVVHGGEKFIKTVEITDDVVAAIEDHVALAPLHNPPNLTGINVARKFLPHAKQVGVFDTAFHQSMPPHAYLYALPRELYTERRIRRYGFHGTSHRYVTLQAAKMLGKDPSEVNLITCHLGNGSSIAAIKNGKSIDTTMGLTPLEGLAMGTRSGDIDPAIIFHLHRTQEMSIDALDKMLNKQSGLLGLSGSSNDVRELELKRENGDENAATAIDVFTYRIRKYIGAYLAALGHTDAIVFTAGIGENSPLVRELTTAGLSELGLSLDEDKNNKIERGAEGDISKANSLVKILVVPTNEEKMIAIDTYEVAQD
ncbi:acetate kinase [Myxococcota bacterium]|nr:acetate kinase [Myxococcota bacterium]